MSELPIPIPTSVTVQITRQIVNAATGEIVDVLIGAPTTHSLTDEGSGNGN